MVNATWRCPSPKGPLARMSRLVVCIQTRWKWRTYSAHPAMATKGQCAQCSTASLTGPMLHGTRAEKDTVDPGDTLVSSISLVGDREYEMKITSTKSGKTITTPYKLEDGQSEEETVVYFVLEHQPDTCSLSCEWRMHIFECLRGGRGKARCEPNVEATKSNLHVTQKAQVVDARTLKITWDASSKTSVSTRWQRTLEEMVKSKPY